MGSSFISSIRFFLRHQFKAYPWDENCQFCQFENLIYIKLYRLVSLNKIEKKTKKRQCKNSEKDETSSTSKTLSCRQVSLHHTAHLTTKLTISDGMLKLPPLVGNAMIGGGGSRSIDCLLNTGPMAPTCGPIL